MQERSLRRLARIRARRSDLEEYVQFNKDFRDAVVSGFNHGLGFRPAYRQWAGEYSHVSRAPSFDGTNVRDLMRHPSAVFT